MKKHQFEEIISGIGIIASLVSYNVLGDCFLTRLIIFKCILDTCWALYYANKKL